MLCKKKDFPKGIFPTLEKRTITSSVWSFPSRLICIINTKISVFSYILQREPGEREASPKANQVPRGDVPKSPTRSHRSLAELRPASCLVISSLKCSQSLASPGTHTAPRATIIAVRFDFALKIHFNQTLLD